MSTHSWASQRLVVPDHVVHREFAAETVVLNLSTGQYHGLNPTAGWMLRCVESAESIDAAVQQLVTDSGQSEERIRKDLADLLQLLDARGLATAESISP